MNVDFLSRNPRLSPYIKLHMFGTLNMVKDTSVYFRVKHEFPVNWLIGLHLVHKIINTGDNLRINYLLNSFDFGGWNVE